MCAAYLPLWLPGVRAQSKKRHNLDTCNRTTNFISHGQNVSVMFPTIVLKYEIGRGQLLLANGNTITLDRTSSPACCTYADYFLAFDPVPKSCRRALTRKPLGTTSVEDGARSGG